MTPYFVVVFPQAPFRVTNVLEPTPVSSNWATAPRLSWGDLGDFVTPFVLEKLFDVELTGSYLGHVPCKFSKVCLGLKYLPQINYGGKLTCFGCSPRIGYHWFVCLLGLQFLHCWEPAAVIWILSWEVLVVLPCQMVMFAGCHYVDFFWTNAHLLSSSGAH